MFIIVLFLDGVQWLKQKKRGDKKAPTVGVWSPTVEDAMTDCKMVLDNSSINNLCFSRSQPNLKYNKRDPTPQRQIILDTYSPRTLSEEAELEALKHDPKYYRSVRNFCMCGKRHKVYDCPNGHTPKFMFRCHIRYCTNTYDLTYRKGLAYATI